MTGLAGATGEALTQLDVLAADAASSGDPSVPSQPVLALRSTPPPWLGDRSWQLADLSTLEAGWDSYGAKPVDRRSIERALEVLYSLAFVDGLGAPVVTASADGHACLVWDDGVRTLEVEVMPDGLLVYTFVCAADDSKDASGRTRQPYELAPLLLERL